LPVKDGQVQVEAATVTTVEVRATIAAESKRVSWAVRYTASLVTLDLAAAAIAGLAVVAVRYQGGAAALGGIDYRLLAVGFAPVWVVTLALTGAYDRRVLGAGTEEFRRVLGGAVRALAGLAIVLVAAKADVARSVVAVGLPSVTASTLAGRWAARGVLGRLRAQGRCVRRVILVGSAAECDQLLQSLSREKAPELLVLGVCTDDGASEDVPVVGGLGDAAVAAASLGADTVAVAGTAGLGEQGLRRLAWSLERRGVDLLVAPGLTFVAVPRIVVRPVDGTPLLHVSEPRLSGPQQLLKACVDRSLALLALVLLSPVLVLLGLVVRATSPGPMLFRQDRVGRDGRVFRIWKLRTMVDGAGSIVVQGNDADGLLFKLREDPRVTPVGRFLRRWSLDELPQLLNVVGGSMALVGPRPPLPSEVAEYGDEVRRRLLVRPGLTGLWQVSGRSDLPWEEAVRLDLQYVENWSLSLDLTIMLRTLSAVLRRQGAY
jgi:exopolysaccharide biosynthesis polyprenyl glycosylphosphotransferase